MKSSEQHNRPMPDTVIEVYGARQHELAVARNAVMATAGDVYIEANIDFLRSPTGTSSNPQAAQINFATNYQQPAHYQQPEVRQLFADDGLAEARQNVAGSYPQTGGQYTKTQDTETRAQIYNIGDRQARPEEEGYYAESA